MLTRKIAQFVYRVPMQTVREQDTIDTAPRLDCLHNGVASRQNMRWLLRCALLCNFLSTFFPVFFGTLFSALRFPFHCSPSPIIRVG